MKAITDITDFIFLEDKPEKADIIFMPGGSYAEQAEKAAGLWKDNYAPLILPSGKYSVKRGFFPGPLSKADRYTANYATEWEFLKDVLLKNGVDEKAILKEDYAENTYENAFKSREVTDRLGLHINKAIICCKSFHARRCFMYYKWAYPDTKLIICPAEAQGINKNNWINSENGIDRVMGELMRCGSQFKEYVMEFDKQDYAAAEIEEGVKNEL
ncbi:MAG: YdcF family protein [Bacillota bacterium]|nr:YdcF family protein [Bacillota bacterium]